MLGACSQRPVLYRGDTYRCGLLLLTAPLGHAKAEHQAPDTTTLKPIELQAQVCSPQCLATTGARCRRSDALCLETC